MVGRGRPRLLEILGQIDPHQKRRLPNDIRLLCFTQRKKVKLLRIGSPLRSPMTVRTAYIFPISRPKGAQKRKVAVSVQKWTSFEESLLQSFFVLKLSAAKL